MTGCNELPVKFSPPGEFPCRMCRVHRYPGEGSPEKVVVGHGVPGKNSEVVASGYPRRFHGDRSSQPPPSSGFIHFVLLPQESTFYLGIWMVCPRHHRRFIVLGQNRWDEDASDAMLFY